MMRLELRTEKFELRMEGSLDRLAKMRQKKKITLNMINKIIKRNMRSERRKNLMVIISIALSSFLICFIGMTLLSIVQSRKNQVMDTYEATYLNLSEDDIKELKNIPEFERVGTTYICGEEKSEEGYKGNILYLDDPILYMFRQQSSLVRGNLPSKYNEIAVSEKWIERYAENTKIGDAITLKMENFQGEYVVTGIFKTAYDNKNVYPFFISDETLQKSKNYNAGKYLAYIHISSDIDAEDIKNFCNRVAEEKNLTLKFNDAYFEYITRETSSQDIAILLGTIGFVLFGSCIVIESIFQISVLEKIQRYGQLRTIGMTRKQIKKMVKKEGIRLGIVGIGIGIVIGTILILIIIPQDFDLISGLSVVCVDILVCYFTVSFSIHKPAQIASTVSPIEAVRYSYKRGENVGGYKKIKKISPIRLGIKNFRRETKKTIKIVMSLSFGGILLLIISSMSLIQSPEKMARQDFLNSDYRIYIDSDKELFDVLYEGNPLNKELRQEILAIPGVNSIKTGRQTGHFRFDFQGVNSSGMCDMITAENRKSIEEAIVEGEMPNHNEILVMKGYEDFGIEPEIGMQMEISLGGEQVPVKISGIFEIAEVPMAYGHGEKGFDAPMMYFPQELFKELMPGIDKFDYSWDISCNSSETEKIEAALNDIIAGNTEIAMDSVYDRCEAYKSIYSPIYGSLQTISWLLFLFGVINLVNTSLSNQLSRQYENGVLCSIGLTRTQLYKMIMSEGILYVLGSIILIIGIGTPMAYLICCQVGKVTYGEVVSYQFPFKEIVIYLFVLCLLEMVLSIWTIRQQRKKTIIEHLRESW